MRKFVINAFLKSLAGLLRKKVLSKNFKFCIFELRMILYLYKEDTRKNCISLTLYQQIIFRQFHKISKPIITSAIEEKDRKKISNLG